MRLFLNCTKSLWRQRPNEGRSISSWGTWKHHLRPALQGGSSPVSTEILCGDQTSQLQTSLDFTPLQGGSPATHQAARLRLHTGRTWVHASYQRLFGYFSTQQESFLEMGNCSLPKKNILHSSDFTVLLEMVTNKWPDEYRAGQNCSENPEFSVPGVVNRPLSALSVTGHRDHLGQKVGF